MRRLVGGCLNFDTASSRRRPISAKPRIALECDSASSVILEVETGRGIALVNTILKRGKRLLYSPLTGMTQAQSVCLARATKGNVTPAGERFCEILRKISDRANCGKTLGV